LHLIVQTLHEERLKAKALKLIKYSKGLRKPITEDVFKLRIYLSPQDFYVVNYLRRTPLSAFNPGAILRHDKLLIFPRLIFDYYNYVSSIGYAELNIDELIYGNVRCPLTTRIILWPTETWEFRGCEDARIHEFNDEYYILYTGFGYLLYGDTFRDLKTVIVQGLAKVSKDLKVKSRGFFAIESRYGRYIPKSNKDGAFIEIKGDKALLLARPTINDVDVCWKGIADLNEHILYEESLEPILGFEPWELKVGWSTNVVKISSNEYLVGWHAVLKEDLSYRNGLAIIDDQGNLLAISNYLLTPRGVEESYGDRPLVIFGTGLVKYKDMLLWIGGLSDYAVGIFIADFNDVLDKLKWLKG